MFDSLSRLRRMAAVASLLLLLSPAARAEDVVTFTETVGDFGPLQVMRAKNICKKYDRGHCERMDCARFHEDSPGYVQRMNKLAEQIDLNGSARVRSTTRRRR